MDEVNFNQGSNVDYTKSKIMNTYRSVKRRMQSRFMQNGILQAKLFLVSSKKSEQDFIESYIETVKNQKDVYIVDEAQWTVKPPGTFSDKRFKVAVGDKKIHSKIVEDNEDLDGLIKQGYRIIEVPLELRRDFERDIDSSLMEFAGISASLSTKFIAYDNLVKSYGKSPNPFTNNVISIGTTDDFLIQDFFKPELIPEECKSKPLFIHLDQSLTGDRTGISGVWTMGLKEAKDYDYETGEFIPVQELVYKHAFTIMILCPSGAEISLEKNRKFIYYLKHSLGLNIQKVTLDGYQSADSKQQLRQAGFDSDILSLDRTSDGYLYLKASINERRISVLEIPELEDELINLERNNMTGKVDHPINGSKDGADSLAGAIFSASRSTDILSLYVVDDFETLDSINEKPYNNNYKEEVINKFSDNLIDNKETKPDVISEIENQINMKTQSINNKENNTISNLINNLTEEERSNVTNDEIENAYYNFRNNDNDLLIW